MPAVAAGMIVAFVIALGVWGSRDGGDNTSAANLPATSPTAATAPAATTVETPATSVVPKTSLTAPIAMGSSGDDVRAVQQRLTDLGFQPGPVDGQFGSGTQQAVWAYKKLVGNQTWEEFAARDDQTAVTDELWQQMQDPSVQIRPRRPGSGTHVEVYLPQQVLAVFTDNKPIFVSHISSGKLNPDGTPATWCETATYDTDENGEPYTEPVTKQVCAESKTPGGVFRFRRYYDGQRISPLGGMKNPWYFNYGIAIHGAQNVPTSPASHGCVRISNTLADVFPKLVSKGDVVYVWGQDGKEPKQYTKRESAPSFNRPDPNATTTTSTTTTTTTTTLPTATTAKPPATTTAPATTATPTTAATTTAPVTP
jgi:peptidoglycan hydrolase-like protein with peptidoglycan-binding domain